ncbi:branched-chain amino acid ABC transporter permease [bacterium]|nr:branched-chain amino acid ABC transporter permease [bacterium]
MALQLTLDGIAVGSLYALIALALVLVYKTSEVINFAQGEMSMVATFVAYSMLVQQGLPFAIAAVGAIAFAAFLGAFFEFAILRRAEEPTLLGLVIITLGFEMILYAAAGWIWGTDQKALPTPVSDMTTYELGPVVLSQVNLSIILVAIIVMVLLFVFFRYTRLGIAMMATSQNPTAAKIMGIKVKRIHALSWALASALGAVTGLLIVPLTFLDPAMMLNPLLKAFAAAVLGGLTSLPGAALGGWILGIVENFVGFYLSPEYKSTVAFLVIVVVLTIRPSGLLAKHRRKKV